MRRNGLQGAQRQAKRRWLIHADQAAPRPADLVERRFVADARNEQWSAWRMDGLLQSGTDLPRPDGG
jgi:hypothetical protein